MKTLMKRTVSVILTLCLLMGFMLPMVSAASDTVTITKADGTSTGYAKAADALTAMTETVEGDKIQIHKNLKLSADYATDGKITVAASEITLDEGVFLNINSQKFYAENAVIDASKQGAYIYNSSNAGDGEFKVKELNCNSYNGGWLPVQSGDKWRFFIANVEVIGTPEIDTETGTSTLRFRVVLTRANGTKEAAYKNYLQNNTLADIGCIFTWTENGEQNTAQKRMVYSDDVGLAQKWGEEIMTNGSGSATKGAIVLTFSGISSFEDLKVMPYISCPTTDVLIKADAQSLN